MRSIEKDVEELFMLCEELNNISQSIDMNTIKKKMTQIKSKAKLTFIYLENAVTFQNFMNQFTHKETVVKLSYIIFKSLYMLNGNYPSMVLNNMSYSLMIDLNYMNKFGNNGNWIKNNQIFRSVLCNVIGQVRPELLEKMIADSMTLLRNPMMLRQNTPDYMNRFIYHMDIVYNRVLAIV